MLNPYIPHTGLHLRVLPPSHNCERQKNPILFLKSGLPISTHPKYFHGRHYSFPTFVNLYKAFVAPSLKASLDCSSVGSSSLREDTKPELATIHEKSTWAFAKGICVTSRLLPFPARVQKHGLNDHVHVTCNFLMCCWDFLALKLWGSWHYKFLSHPEVSVARFNLLEIVAEWGWRICSLMMAPQTRAVFSFLFECVLIQLGLACSTPVFLFSLWGEHLPSLQGLSLMTEKERTRV